MGIEKVLNLKMLAPHKKMGPRYNHIKSIHTSLELDQMTPNVLCRNHAKNGQILCGQCAFHYEQGC